MRTSHTSRATAWTRALPFLRSSSRTPKATPVAWARANLVGGGQRHPLAALLACVVRYRGVALSGSIHFSTTLNTRYISPLSAKRYEMPGMIERKGGRVPSEASEEGAIVSWRSGVGAHIVAQRCRYDAATPLSTVPRQQTREGTCTVERGRSWNNPPRSEGEKERDIYIGREKEKKIERVVRYAHDILHTYIYICQCILHRGYRTSCPVNVDRWDYRCEIPTSENLSLDNQWCLNEFMRSRKIHKGIILSPCF